MSKYIEVTNKIKNLSMNKILYLSSRVNRKIIHNIEDTFRILQHQPHNQEVVNKKEVRVVGLQRSGNHAIINWIRQQESKMTTFLNHCKVLENPYRNVYENLTLRGLDPKRAGVYGLGYEDIDYCKNQAKGKFSIKDCLIYSYEDLDLERITHTSFEKKRVLYLGKSEQRYDVIIMRDPFNLFASRLKRSQPKPGSQKINCMEVYSRKRTLPELWIAYAKECLGETNLLRGKKIFINYNTWCSDIDYRQEIAEKINLIFTDQGFNNVSGAGGGSSFNYTNFNNKASRMDVLNRWQSFIDNPSYRQLISNEELLEYSEKIFGHIPGTESFFKSLSK